MPGALLHERGDSEVFEDSVAADREASSMSDEPECEVSLRKCLAEGDTAAGTASNEASMLHERLTNLEVKVKLYEATIDWLVRKYETHDIGTQVVDVGGDLAAVLANPSEHVQTVFFDLEGQELDDAEAVFCPDVLAVHTCGRTLATRVCSSPMLLSVLVKGCPCRCQRLDVPVPSPGFYCRFFAAAGVLVRRTRTVQWPRSCSTMRPGMVGTSTSARGTL